MKIGILILGIIVTIAAFVMKYIGETSSHLSELKDFWYIPLPLGILLIALAFKKSQPKKEE